jgi:hypothetical protein
MKPWYDVVKPREDLREGRPLDASEFAVHLDHVRDGRGADVYKNPREFFERTYLTKNLRGLAAQVVRRLSGVRVETSAVFNLSTQFGGGKTHALTLLYHLARNADNAKSFKGVPSILEEGDVRNVPAADTAVFVGTEFDSIAGRGGSDGTPRRQTPWGEIAFQLGGAETFNVVAEHDARLVAPGGDVLERMLGAGKPKLILLDELMNYISRSRRSGLSTQLYDFLHNLSEVARGRSNVVLAVSIPASELEMTAEDQSDFDRYKKLLDRLGKAVVMSAETETSEIIRRRLFEWGGLPKEGRTTASEYSEWLLTNRQQVPTWFPVEGAREAFEAAYPFHPTALSVFERKWQGLPRFQQTRGILRLLALWVSRAYTEGYKGAHKDPLISLGTAPLEDSLFRAAVFEQLGEPRLEAAVTTDVAGAEYAHAVRLDAEAIPEVKKARLHRKVATSVFFESNGGQHRGEATLPEIRLAVGEPSLDIGHIEQCLESLADACYFLTAEKNRFRFSFQANLNKLLADRRASVPSAAIQERIRAEILKVFAVPKGAGIEPSYFPEKSGQIPDRPALTLCVLHPEHAAGAAATSKLIAQMTSESGTSGRTFKSALIWAVAEDGASLAEEARKVLAWKDIETDSGELKLDEGQRRQLVENVKRAERDLRETVWRSYKNVFLLAEDNSFRRIDLGLVHSSAAASLVELILSRLKQEDLVVEGVSPNFLTRYWPPALTEWGTKSVRDAFYASPRFPRLLRADAVRDTISRGLDAGLFAYVGKTSDGPYEPFVYRRSLPSADVEISDDVFLISRERADEYVRLRETGAGAPVVPGAPPAVGETVPGAATPATGPAVETSGPTTTSGTMAGFQWSGELPAQKWMNFYTKVLSRFATGDGMKLTVTVDVTPKAGIPKSKVDETRVALRELGLPEGIHEKKSAG